MTAIALLEKRFVAAVIDYLDGQGEAARAEAYEVGRQALEAGLGVMEMADLHDAALREVVAPAKEPDWSRRAGAAGELFREVLAPFEMMLRGYRQANEELRVANATLHEQALALGLVNRELEAFSYSVSHDLRAPLRSIDGFSNALLEDLGSRLDEAGARHLRQVREAAQRMGHLIDGLLELSRVSRTELHRTRVDVTALAQRIVSRMREEEPERRVEVVIPDSIVADGDARLVELVLQNLLENAWKFTARREHARIELGQLDADGVAAYFVRDNGAGFDMASAHRLFGAFQRLHSASEFEGTGIGLATVQRIVHRHGGRAWAEGREGEGATVTFTLGDRGITS